MRISHLASWLFGLFLTNLLTASTGHAEVFKWVDKNGQTHYSQNKEEAGRAKADELKVKAPPTSDQETNSSAQRWREQESLFQQRQAQKRKEMASGQAAAKKPRSLSGGREDGSDASRCALARDVLSGAVRHGNGAPTDAHDREVAENDVRTFCR